MIVKFLALALASSALMAAPALAQATQANPTQPSHAAAAPGAPNVTVGATVVDTSGNPVGTIDSVNGGTAVLATGTVKAQIPASSFAKGPKGLVIGITKADLEAQVAQATTPQEITAGMAVNDSKGGVVGKVDAVSGDMVTVATASSKAQLPKSAFAQGPNGLVIAMTAEQLDSAVKAAAPAATGQ